MRADDNAWDIGTISQLRRLWAEQPDGRILSTAQIGRIMNISKSAVVGKAHRLGLDPRPSPIRKKGQAPVPRPHRLKQGQSTLPSVLNIVSPMPEYVAPKPKAALSNRPCCWPIGHPGQPGFHFCGAIATQNKPYCPEHCSIAYVKPSRAREEDAA